MLLCFSIFEDEALAADVVAPSGTDFVVGKAGWLAVDDSTGAPEPLDSRTDSPVEVMTVRVPVMATVAVVRLRR